jgi:hypothetical protein
MKILQILLFLCISVLPFGAPQTAIAATLLTFDDLSPGSSSGVIPNGYGGLQWQGFGVVAGTQFPTTAYYTGMVSPSNVAFNFDQYNRRAYISSSAPFNLDSAYLTSGIYAPMRIEVQGFVGDHLTFDNTYPVQASVPTLINCNYSGVNSIEFLPQVAGSTDVSDAYIFVMDNVSITTVPEPSVWALFAVGAALAGSGLLLKKPKGMREN